MSEKWECTIVIDGESAESLFAAGPIDLKEFFLPEKLGVKTEDVKSITFIDDISDAPSEEYASRVFGERTIHKDNYKREINND